MFVQVLGSPPVHVRVVPVGCENLRTVEAAKAGDDCLKAVFSDTVHQGSEFTEGRNVHVQLRGC